MTNWALAIGINKYQRLRSLEFAVRDAEAVRDFLRDEAGFERVFYFSDKSPDEIAPDGSPQSTQPTYGNLWSFLLEFCEEPYLEAGDNFWFFFSGHGIRHQERDYLMPCDANPRAVTNTAISISYLTERLRRCGADNVVLFLDACRNQGDKAGVGIGIEKHQGVITISSCSPQERAYEIEEIGQSSFTYALLESLRIQGEGNCATVERLYQRLRYWVSQINNYYNKPQQIPYAIIEPASKYHLILLPRQATMTDIATLREDALEAELEGNLELAEQLWTRILAVSPADPKALKALKRVWLKGLSEITPEKAERDVKLDKDAVAEYVNSRTIKPLKKSTVLWVDDRPRNNIYERQSLEALGINFVLAQSTEEAFDKLNLQHFDLIISDMGRPPDPRAGYTLLDQLRSCGDRTPFIIYAADANHPQHIAESLRHGAIGSTNRRSELFEMVLSLLVRSQQ